MTTLGDGPSAWLLVVIVAAVSLPWLAAIAWAWRRRPRDGAIPLSLAEQVRRRA